MDNTGQVLQRSLLQSPYVNIHQRKWTPACASVATLGITQCANFGRATPHRSNKLSRRLHGRTLARAQLPSAHPCRQWQELSVGLNLGCHGPAITSTGGLEKLHMIRSVVCFRLTLVESDHSTRHLPTSTRAPNKFALTLRFPLRLHL
jgi:hypothetical protein